MWDQDAIAAAIGAYVEAGELAGAVMLAWRDGEAQVCAVGWRDVEARLPVARDTIFRIASMSKPVTSVAAMMLWEEGRLALDQPIAEVAPEFSDTRVLRSPTGPLDDTIPAERPITFEHLLTHRSGITYGDFHPGPIDAAYHAALGPHIDNAIAPDDWVAALARLPLIDQPGGGFHYGHSTDLLGFLIARIEGRPLGEVLRRRIFEPLGMNDTGFTVPPSQRHRRAATHGFDAARGLVRFDAPSTGAFLAERPEGMAYCGGGAGLWSTVDDYLAFARLFVEGGRGLLKPETIATIRTNRLSPEHRAAAEMMGVRPFAVGHGFGLGVAVVMEPEQAPVVRCGGGEGSVGWPGAYGGWWQADPNDGSVLIFLTHNMVDLAQLAEGVGFGVYMAITDFQRLASAP